jgi:hypothetical protein
MQSNQRSSQLGRTLYFFNFTKGEKMDITPQPEPQEVNLQERAVETLTDNSLPAAQVIEEQNNDAELNNAPRFVP